MITFFVGFLFFAIIYFVFVEYTRNRVVAFLMFLSLTISSEWYVQLASIRIGNYDIAFVIGLFVFIVEIKTNKIKFSRMGIIVVTLLLMIAVSWLLHSDAPTEPVLVYNAWKFTRIAFLVTYVVAGVVLSHQSSHVVSRVLTFFLIGISINACLGVLQTVSGGSILSHRNNLYFGFLNPIADSAIYLFDETTSGYSLGFTRATGTFLDSTWYAPMMVLSAAFSFSEILFVNDSKLKSWFNFLMIATAVFCSGSRGGIVAFVIIIAIAVSMTWRNNVKLSMFSLFFCGLFVSILLLMSLNVENSSLGRLLERFGTTFNFNSDISFLGRIKLWEVAVGKLISDGLFTVLFGKSIGVTRAEVLWGGALSKSVNYTLPLHNQFVSILYHTGFVSFCLFCGFYFSALKSAYFLLKMPEIQRNDRYIGLAVFSGFLGLFVVGMVSDWFAYTSFATAASFWFFGTYVIIRSIFYKKKALL